MITPMKTITRSLPQIALGLVPLAPLGVKLGHYLVKRSTPSFYYAVISFFLVLIGAKLLWEGVSALGTAAV